MFVSLAMAFMDKVNAYSTPLLPAQKWNPVRKPFSICLTFTHLTFISPSRSSRRCRRPRRRTARPRTSSRRWRLTSGWWKKNWRRLKEIRFGIQWRIAFTWLLKHYLVFIPRACEGFVAHGLKVVFISLNCNKTLLEFTRFYYGSLNLFTEPEGTFLESAKGFAWIDADVQGRSRIRTQPGAPGNFVLQVRLCNSSIILTEYFANVTLNE